MSPQTVAWLLLAGSGTALLATWAIRHWGAPARAARVEAETARAMQLFRMQREQLEAKFFDVARALGTPRGLQWLDCDWLRDATFARACDTGRLTAFVSVNIRFQAVSGSDMEGLAAVDAVRDAAAVFQYQTGRWSTAGRALFNMNPAQALQHLSGQFQPVPLAGVK